MEEFNVAIFLLINQYAGKNSLLDATLIAAAEAMPYFLILIIIYMWFDVNLKIKKSSFHAALSVLLGMFISYVTSLFYYHSRPFVDKLGTQLVEHAPDSSLPSDHTTFIFSISVMLLFNKSTRFIGTLLCVGSFISGLSRVFVGVHYPLDILAAIMVATLSSIVVFKSQSKTNHLFMTLLAKIPNKLIKRD